MRALSLSLSQAQSITPCIGWIFCPGHNFNSRVKEFERYTVRGLSFLKFGSHGRELFHAVLVMDEHKLLWTTLEEAICKPCRWLL